jgi:hypothetical protein
MNGPGASSFDYLDRMSDERALFEHAAGTIRREEHGYCVDDNARLLVVASREPANKVADRLARLALAFVLEAQSADGQSRNRMNRAGRWTDKPTTEDCWGRSLWALGAAAVHNSDPSIRRSALLGFQKGVQQRSSWPRAMAFAALGAADVLAADPENDLARSFLVDALEGVDTLDVAATIPAGPWAWFEPRLRYANAALAESIIAAGAALKSRSDVERGLAMLTWLLEIETPHGHLSVTGSGGRGPKEHGPQFDQQPIEVAAMADACWRAYSVTGDETWARAVTTAAHWFTGANDVGLVMYDEVSGGGFDGLQPNRVNVNQGAESTLALISTMQRARSFVSMP